MQSNFHDLLNQKIKEYDSLSLEYQDMKDLSQQIEKELETEIDQLTKEKARIVHENERVQHQLQELKKKNSNETSFLEKKMDRLTSENEKLKADLSTKNRLVVQSEIEVERLESQLRESQMNISDLESKIDQTLEKLAMVQSQLEITKAYNEEEIQRLKDKIQESQSEALAFKAREQMSRAQNNSVRTEAPRFVDLSQFSGHYQAYEGNDDANGGHDPLPQKKRKLNFGKRVDEDSVYEQDDENMIRKPKRNGTRSKKTEQKREESDLYCPSKVNNGYSETLFLLNDIMGDLKKDTSNHRSSKSSKQDKQKKKIADLFMMSYNNLSLTSLI